MIKKYKKKPIIIEAVQWMGDNFDKISEFFDSKERNMWGEGDSIIIETLEGQMYARIGDWIIKGIANEFYPCKPDIFKKTYEEVKE